MRLLLDTEPELPLAATTVFKRQQLALIAGVATGIVLADNEAVGLRYFHAGPRCFRRVTMIVAGLSIGMTALRVLVALVRLRRRREERCSES